MLVTHQVHFALSADLILVLKEVQVTVHTCMVISSVLHMQGSVEAYGSHADLLSKGLDPEHLLGLITAEAAESGKQELYSHKNGAGDGEIRMQLYAALTYFRVIDDENGTGDVHSPLLSPAKDSHKPSPFNSFFKAQNTTSPSQLRKRHVQFSQEVLPDASLLDAASIYSSPSMFSDEDLASPKEDKIKMQVGKLVLTLLLLLLLLLHAATLFRSVAFLWLFRRRRSRAPSLT